MTPAFAIPILLAALAGAVPDSTGVAPDSTGARPDSTVATPDTSRVVRQFPTVEVRALLHDMRSSQTVHLIPPAALHKLPVDRLTEVLELQPGVVAQGEELHVRGGRAGETVVYLDGLRINEPLRGRAMEVPLLGLRGAELVSGAPDAQYGGGLAGVLNLHSADPGDRPEFEWKWQTDGGLDTRYDRGAARFSTPVPRTGYGIMLAADATFDDTWLPALATESRHDLAGLSVGWRAENRMQGAVKIAPVGRSDGPSAELFASRRVYQPYSPNWSVDGWMQVPANVKATPIYSPVPLPGYERYVAADHLAMTDDRNLAAQFKYEVQNATFAGALGLGWLRTQGWRSIQGRKTAHDPIERPRYGNVSEVDMFYVLWGDDPLYRETESDVLTLRADGTIPTRRGYVSAGAGVTYEDVRSYELDHMPLSPRSGDPVPLPLDSVRTYDVQAPGFFGYAQTRWNFEGLVLNAGLRGEYFGRGEEAVEQTLPGTTDGVWSISPRLGLAYPISNRDVFSLAYMRIQQSPGRDYLYDTRTVIGDRQPLGNPMLDPATSISYEAAVKHIFSTAWALQSSVFYRDVYGQIGSHDEDIAQGPVNLQYDDEDNGHALGFELAVHHTTGENVRFDAVYTWLQAWGNESRPEGDPYGPIRSPEIPALGTQPLSWDRRHSFAFSGAWSSPVWSLGWSTAIGSPLPWTPKERREMFTDLGVVNSRRFGWVESTNLSIGWTPPNGIGLQFGLEVRNLFDGRYERIATLDGYPNPVVNTLYDDYGAYRTETGKSGGAYWSTITDEWIAVHDPRLYYPPRMVRASVGARW